MEIYKKTIIYTLQGRAQKVKELVAVALREGNSANDILEHGLLAGMSILSEKFKNNEVYVPEVLVAARAMNAGLGVLKAEMMKPDIVFIGKAVLGTVKGDLHNIGKNLLKIMLEGRGIYVIDLGVDVSAEKFVQAAIENKAKIIACSALLTTAMITMRDVVALANDKGIRGKVKILVGGAPVSQNFCDNIGADYYAPDAASASDIALKICEK